MKLSLPLFCAVVLLGKFANGAGTPTPTPSPTPWPPKIARSPHAIFIMDDTYGYGTNSAVGGLRKQIRWTDIQPDSGSGFNWTTYDQLIAGAQNTYHKQIEFSLWLLTTPPAWLLATPGVTTYTLQYKTGVSMPMVLPWEPPVQSALINLISAFCDRYDGQIEGIVMGGIGFATESYFPVPNQLTPALPMTLTDEIAAWTTSSNLLIDTYAAHLQYTPFILAVGIPFTGDGQIQQGTDAITAVVNHGLLYQNFGLMNWALNAKSNTAFLPWGLVYDYSPTNAAGFQLVGSTAGNGGKLNGTLAQALTAGIALRAQWIEVYASDAKNPVYASLLRSTAALLYPSP